MDLRSRRFASSARPDAGSANSDDALNLCLEEWLGIEVERDHAHRARMQAFAGPLGTKFIVMPGNALKGRRWPSSTSPKADTWPMDPGTEMSIDELLGLRERIDRTTRGRMALFTGPAGTMVILTDGKGRQAAAVRASPPQPDPARRSFRPATRISGTRPLRRQEGDTAGLLSTAEAAEYCGFANDSALRVAKLRGLITPDQTGPRRCHLWRQATLDAYLTRTRTPSRVPAPAAMEVPDVTDEANGAIGSCEVLAEMLSDPPLDVDPVAAEIVTVVEDAWRPRPPCIAESESIGVPSIR